MKKLREQAVLLTELRPLPWSRATMIGAVFIACYLLLGWISHIYPMDKFNITPWTPQPALAIVLLMMGGRRWLPAVFAATTLAALLIRGVPASITFNLLIAAVVTLAYFAIAQALTRLFPIALKIESRRDMFRLISVVAVGSLGIALARAAIFVASGTAPIERYLEATVRSWIGNSVGILVTLPLLLMMLDAERRSQIKALLLRTETFAQIAVVGAVLWIVFGHAATDDFRRFYLLFLPLVWAATRSGMVGAVVVTMFIQAGVILAVQIGDYQTLTVVELQALLLALASTGFLLGVTVEERQRATIELRESLRLAAAGEMAAALAHELNQPLTAVSSYSEVSQWLAASPDGDRQQLIQTLGKLGNEATRAADIVRRLRDFFSTGVTQLQEVSLPKVAEDVIESLRSRTDAIRATVKLRAPETTPSVLADVLQIELVIRNLIENAMDAVSDNTSDAKVIYIDIEPKYTQYIQLSVTDSGPGIPPERIKSIFHAFSTTKATGMGMGLAISRAIIEAHGGQLWARPGNRGLLSFALPLKDTNDE